MNKATTAILSIVFSMLFTAICFAIYTQEIRMRLLEKNVKQAQLCELFDSEVKTSKYEVKNNSITIYCEKVKK